MGLREVVEINLSNLRSKNFVGSARNRTPCIVVTEANSVANISHGRLNVVVDTCGISFVARLEHLTKQQR